MVIINMENVYSKIDGVPVFLKKEINDILNYEIGGFGVKKEKIYLYDFINHQLLTGLVPYLISILKNNRIPYSINDKRVKPQKNGNFKVNKDFQARDYQKDIIDRASSREVLQAATGAGKTFIMASLIEKFNVKPVVVIAPKVSLALQIKEEFERFLGVNVGIVGGGYNQIEDITVGTPQSLSEEVIKLSKLIMCDESHNIPCNTIVNVFKMATNAYYRIGVSATPWRDGGDDILIEAVLNIRRPQLSLNASKLIQKGKLVPCTINMIKFDNSNIDWQGNYNSTYTRAISHNVERNQIIVDLAHKEVNNGRTPIILVSKIGHGNILLGGLKRKLGYAEKMVTYNNKSFTIGNIEFVSGVDDIDRRQAVFKSVKEGFTKVLIGSTIADEGLDLPILDCLILAGSGKCSTRAFQRIGRVLRLYPNKFNAIVYDFIDMNMTFYKHAMIRKSLYKTEPEWKINEIKLQKSKCA